MSLFLPSGVVARLARTGHDDLAGLGAKVQRPNRGGYTPSTGSRRDGINQLEVKAKTLVVWKPCSQGGCHFSGGGASLSGHSTVYRTATNNVKETGIILELRKGTNRTRMALPKARLLAREQGLVQIALKVGLESTNEKLH